MLFRNHESIETQRGVSRQSDNCVVRHGFARLFSAATAACCGFPVGTIKVSGQAVTPCNIVDRPSSKSAAMRDCLGKGCLDALSGVGRSTRSIPGIFSLFGRLNEPGLDLPLAPAYGVDRNLRPAQCLRPARQRWQYRGCFRPTGLLSGRKYRRDAAAYHRQSVVLSARSPLPPSGWRCGS